jgi:hypothetical protein
MKSSNTVLHYNIYDTLHGWQKERAEEATHDISFSAVEKGIFGWPKTMWQHTEPFYTQNPVKAAFALQCYYASSSCGFRNRPGNPIEKSALMRSMAIAALHEIVYLKHQPDANSPDRKVYQSIKEHVKHIESLSRSVLGDQEVDMMKAVAQEKISKSRTIQSFVYEPSVQPLTPK